MKWKRHTYAMAQTTLGPVFVFVIIVRTVHSPTYSGGIRWTLADSGGLRRTLADSISVTWAKFVCLVRTVRWVCRSLLESAGVCRIPEVFTLPHRFLLESGRIRRNEIWQGALPKLEFWRPLIPLELGHSGIDTGMVPGMHRNGIRRNGLKIKLD